MSRQQINLYQQDKTATGFSLNSSSALACIGLLVVIMIIFGLLQQSGLSAKQAQLTQLQNEEEQLQQQIDNLRSSVPIDRRIQLENQLAQLQQKLADLQQIGTLMARQERTEVAGFATQLSSLGNQHLRGIALSEIHLLRGGQHLELAGNARPAETVPQYLQRLQSDTAFSNSTFGPLQLERDEQRSDIINFRLGKHREGDSQ